MMEWVLRWLQWWTGKAVHLTSVWGADIKVTCPIEVSFPWFIFRCCHKISETKTVF
jgi:hypothetical protein